MKDSIIKTHFNGLIKIMDDFLSEDDIEMCLEYIKYRKNSIQKNNKLSKIIWEKYRNKFLEINSEWIGLYENVTITNSNKPITKHRDINIHGEKEKILIYLNEIKNGGTIFLKDGETFLIENRRNRLVCFDISLYHLSENFDEKIIKMGIGFRPKISSII